jgi:hypothetical protein
LPPVGIARMIACLEITVLPESMPGSAAILRMLAAHLHASAKRRGFKFAQARKKILSRLA